MIRTAAAVSIGLAALVAGPGESKAQNSPWCAIVEVAGAMGENCGFATYEQCIATVRGQGGYCERNARYRAPADRNERRSPQGNR